MFNSETKSLIKVYRERRKIGNRWSTVARTHDRCNDVTSHSRVHCIVCISEETLAEQRQWSNNSNALPSTGREFLSSVTVLRRKETDQYPCALVERKYLDVSLFLRSRTVCRRYPWRRGSKRYVRVNDDRGTEGETRERACTRPDERPANICIARRVCGKPVCRRPDKRIRKRISLCRRVYTRWSGRNRLE